MIRSVSIRNWKAYDSLETELMPGTTFLIARNGVGKTSFLQAVLWGLLGTEASGIDGDAARRGDATATVRLELELPGHGAVSLTRSRAGHPGRGRPKESLTFHHPRGEGGQEQWLAMLSETWGASPKLMARLMLLPEHAVWEELNSPTSVDVSGAIRSLLGLEALDELTAVARRESRKSERMARESRSISVLEVEAAESAVARARESHEEAEAEVQALREMYAARMAETRFREAHSAWRREYQEWQTGTSAAKGRAVELLSTVLGEVTSDDLEGAIERLNEVVHTLNSELAQARAALAMTERHSNELVAGHECPVCLRPMDSVTVEVAARRHAQLREELAAQIDDRQQSRTHATRVLHDVEALKGQISSVPPAEPSRPDELSEARTPRIDSDMARFTDAELLDRGRQAAARAEALRDSLGAARARLTDMRDQESAWSQAVSAFRGQGLSKLVGTTSIGMSSALTSEAADPLTELIKEQWKKLPLGQSLNLEADGSISVLRSGRALDYRCLSGGEKAQVILVYRVAALKALSEVPLLLLDEPLEHLDPRNRWRFGRMVSALTQSGALRQTLITTYEEPLARRLAFQAARSDAPAISLCYLANS